MLLGLFCGNAGNWGMHFSLMTFHQQTHKYKSLTCQSLTAFRKIWGQNHNPASQLFHSCSSLHPVGVSRQRISALLHLFGGGKPSFKLNQQLQTLLTKESAVWKGWKLQWELVWSAVRNSNYIKYTHYRLELWFYFQVTWTIWKAKLQSCYFVLSIWARL